MNCSNCGTFNQGGNNCINCGAPLYNNQVVNNSQPSTGTLNFNRPKSMIGALIPVDIFVDGYVLGSVSNGKSVQFPIYYGTHTLEAKTAYETASMQITVNDMQRNLVFEVGIDMGLVVSHTRLIFTHYYN